MSADVVRELLDSPEANQYESLVKEWETCQTTGYLTGSPLKRETIDRNSYGVRSFWKYLQNKSEYRECRPSLEHVTLDNVRRAIAAVPADMPATRENIYKSLLAFYRFLVYKGLRQEADLNGFRAFKPAKNKNPRRTVIKEDGDFQKLLAENQAWSVGRTEYDKILTRMILCLGYHTGLRNSEMCSLLLEDVLLKVGVIRVVLGKGDKNRVVGIRPELEEEIKAYLAKRPKTKCKNFLVQEHGTPLNKKTLGRRVRNLGRKAGIEITPHGLRRSLITQLLLEGVPAVKVQKIAGHSHLETTELYDMSADEDALDVLRGRQRPKVAPKTEQSSPPEVRPISPISY
ncbi:MAG TPA: site-specific integrase [Oculatellaceae cyanobacterium]|jgi:site-specific recombinase XerD